MPDQVVRDHLESGGAEDDDVALLRYALGLEIEAAARYTHRADGTSDPRFATYFESLRRNESQHRDELCRRLEARGADQREGAAPASLARIALHHTAARLECPDVPGFRSIAAALAGDLDLERRAVKIYGTSAAAAHDPSVKELFRELARGEAGHARGLRTWLQRLVTVGFPVIFFCPLCGWELDLGASAAEGTQLKCPMCPGRFALRLHEGDWVLERLRLP